LAAGLAAAAVATALSAGPLGQRWLRETTALLVTAAGAALAYGLDATPTEITVVALGVAVVSTVATFVARGVGRAGEWVRPVLVLNVFALVAADVAGGRAGPGWLALALLVTSVEATAFAVVSEGALRQGLQAVGVVSAGGSWAALCGWQDWELAGSATATALASGVVAVGLALGARYGRLGREWVAGWATLPTVGLVFTAGALSDTVRVERSPTGPALAAGLAAAAVATALSAGPLGQRWLRETTALLVTAAGAALAYGLDATPTQAVAGVAVVSTTATLLVVVGSSFERATAWIRPGLVLGTLSALIAVAIAAAELPARPLLVVALLVTALDSVALGLAGRRRGFLLASPVLFCLAWLTFASEALTGNPQWYTVPIGVTVLAIVGLARWDRHRGGEVRSTPTLVALEYVGMAFVVSPALVQIVAEQLGYGLLAIVEALVLVAWGVLTRVRRRALFGSGAVVVAAALVVIVPLVGLVPKVGGPGLWLAIAALGVTAILVAAFLEQGRTATRRGVQRLRDLTSDWE
jgi:hypothetical protein